MEQTLVLVKGDGVKRRLVGEIIRRIEAKSLDIRTMQLMEVSRKLAEEHYAEHREKPFFEELVEFITATPVVAMRVEGEGAIAVTRRLMGATNPAEAAPGTIRGAPALSPPGNRAHGARFRPARPPPPAAAPGPTRGALALSLPDNLAHGSDSLESAERELKLFFGG